MNHKSFKKSILQKVTEQKKFFFCKKVQKYKVSYIKCHKKNSFPKYNNSFLAKNNSERISIFNIVLLKSDSYFGP